MVCSGGSSAGRAIFFKIMEVIDIRDTMLGFFLFEKHYDIYVNCLISSQMKQIGLPYRYMYNVFIVHM